MLTGNSKNLSQLNYDDLSLLESLTPNNLIAAEPQGSYESSPQQWVKVVVNCPIKPEQQSDKASERNIVKLLDYSIPSNLTVCVGDVVIVPVQSQIVGGIVTSISTTPPYDLIRKGKKIKDVKRVTQRKLLSPSYINFLEDIAKYYLTDLREVIKVALPPGVFQKYTKRVWLDKYTIYRKFNIGKKALISLSFSKKIAFTLFYASSLFSKQIIPDGYENFCTPTESKIIRLLQSQKNGDYSVEYIRSKIKGADRAIKKLIERGWIESYLEPPKLAKPKLKTAITLTSNSFLNDLKARQREILQILKNEGGELWLKDFIQLASTTSATLKKLETKGYVVLSEREILRKEQGVFQEADQPKELSQAQAEALEVINAQQNYAQILLHGVTGSGKTEVYLQAIAPILAQGKSVLVLVPEIGLTPQLTDRFRARFGEQVCVYHSKLSGGERYDTWRQTIQGEPQVVIGTRSAIFAPLPNLGLIVLDEEHDSSFKQDRPMPTYHARKVAQWRAELENCPIILGSATPSLESLVAVGEDGEDREALSFEATVNTVYLSLPERIASRPLPKVEIVDLRQELNRGNRSIFSLSLQNAIANMQEQGQQGILFIPRRGHSTFVSCRSCGYVMECPDCDVSLSYHYAHEGAAKLLRCHYCNHTRIQPDSCPECSSPYLKFFGSGTQKVTQELVKLFPDLKCIRFDSDTTRKKGEHRRLIDRFRNKEADILIGTQMLTKGLDIAGVTLVGIVAADGLLHRSDYRAAERTFQTLTQVAGRAGRGDLPGRVIVQTYTPEHPVIQTVKTHDYTSFSATELTSRAELNYPPYGKLILIKLSSIDPVEVQQAAETLANLLIDILNKEYEILGPAPANIMRVARRYRWQILLKLPLTATANLPDLNTLRSHLPKSVSISITIDVDPINME